MSQYIYRSANELAKLIREGEASSFGTVKEHLDRIKERNGELNAFVSVFEDEGPGCRG
jgi:Asp-tRNA(Asn)/Glu-tRNA(Gln) amidotransferase A subunit family amidase